MNKPDKIDYARLLGFDSVRERISGRVDFQDDAIGAKLGAKVGNPEDGPARQPAKIEYAKLLGFDGVGEVSGSVDFQDETMNARLGAKVGVEAMQ
jgi:hypothetical protein